MSRQVKWEIDELNSPTALQRFGAPFRSEHGEVSPQESELPILRYIFVHHVRHFPFLDKAREKEFWQDKLQVVRAPRAPSPASRAPEQRLTRAPAPVSRVVCRQANLVVARPPRGDQA